MDLHCSLCFDASSRYGWKYLGSKVWLGLYTGPWLKFAAGGSSDFLSDRSRHANIRCMGRRFIRALHAGSNDHGSGASLYPVWDVGLVRVDGVASALFMRPMGLSK